MVRESMKWLVLAMMLLVLIGCASAPTEERFSLMSPAKEILANDKFLIAPMSVIHEYLSSGDKEVDSYLQGNGDIWQKEIAEFLEKKLGSKAGILQISAAEFKDKIQAALKARGREGFINPNTGDYDAELYKDVIIGLAGQYKATLIVPNLTVKLTPFYKGSLTSRAAGFAVLITMPLDALSSSKVAWDGVSRPFETGGSKLSGMFGGESEGNLPVISLHIGMYNPDKMIFWGNGGFDVRSKAGANSIVQRDVKEIFNNQKHLKESIEVAFEPLLSQL